jgi:hypothetical protein
MLPISSRNRVPPSVVVHIDYQKAPAVVQRFGDIKKLITQTLDPLLSAYFRDIAHKKTMLELLHDRDQIQHEARQELRKRFIEFDIELGDGQSKRVALEGEAEANVLRQKIGSYGDPRLYALSVVSQYLAESKQPLVPAHLFVTGQPGDGPTQANGLLGALLAMLVAEKSGAPLSGSPAGLGDGTR